MFAIPLSAITFDDVVRFCQNFPEGVRLEYKREPGQHPPKIVSSFANTAGGIWVIGVDTDPTTNLPRPPFLGIDMKGIEERIVQSAQTAIYPAITPAVRAIPVPDQAGRVVAVVKVPESIEAPHAIENSTRVYIRAGSINQPYELADIDRIEYLIKRRVEPEKRREGIIQQMAERSLLRGGIAVRTVIAPVYPRGILLPMDHLLDQVDFLGQQGGSPFLTDWRSIHNGIWSSGLVPGETRWHFEADVHGVVFVEQPIRAENSADDPADNRRFHYLVLGQLVVPLATAINTALALLKGTITNILIRYELFNLVGIGFLLHDPGALHHKASVVRNQLCLNPRIDVSITTVLETLSERRADVVTDILRRVLYAFNCRPKELAGPVNSVLKNENLI